MMCGFCKKRKNNVSTIDWIVSSLNSYVEALTFNVTIFEGRAFRRSLSLDEAVRIELSWWNYCPYKNKHTPLSFSPQTCTKNIERNKHQQPEEQALIRHQFCRHLDSRLPIFRTPRNKFLLSKPHKLWYFVKAAWGESFLCQI